ncbi:MAG: alpha/beta fold hydrolase [Caldilineaceae bacterium]|nr:alpha/beta fold hydrolase [Caldilineaceae bacterium]
MRMRSAFLFMLLWLLALAEPAHAQTPPQPSAPPSTTPGRAPRVAGVDCALWEIPQAYDETYDAECGYVRVPERRDGAAQQTIQIAYLRLRSAAPAPAPPVIFLAGGPGDSGINGLGSSAGLVDALLAARDVIALDQRGTGHSIPSLNCTDWIDAAAELPLEETSAAELTGCRDYWQGQGYDVAAYTTAENAADAIDVADALGYPQVLLLGESYGTKLAQVIMRRYPDRVVAAVLDGAVPVALNQEVEQLPKMAYAFERAFALCAADQACAAYYPNLGERFYALIARLDAEPLVLTVGEGGESREETVRGIDLVTALFIHLIQGSYAVAEFPYRVVQLEKGDTAYLAQLYAEWDWVDPLWGTGMNITVHCSEEIMLASEAEFNAALAAYPNLEAAQRSASPTEYTDLLAECTLWGAQPAPPDYAQPITSAVPSLILQGGLDFQTPIGWATQVQATLPNSKLVYLPTSGHITTYATVCGAQIATQFIVNPAAPLDTSCVDTLAAPRFYVPQLMVDAPTKPVLIPAQEGGEIIGTVLPVNWRQRPADPVFFGPLQAGQIIAFFAGEDIGGPLSALLHLLAESEAGEVEQWTTGDLTWEVLTVPDTGTRLQVFAARRHNQSIYTVALDGIFVDPQGVVETVFKPALAAHRVGDKALAYFQAVRFEPPDEEVVLHTRLLPGWQPLSDAPLTYIDPTGFVDVTVSVMARGVIAAKVAGEITGEEEPLVERVIVGERTWAIFVSYDARGAYIHALTQDRRGSYLLTLGLYGAYYDPWIEGVDRLYPMMVGFDVARR